MDQQDNCQTINNETNKDKDNRTDNIIKVSYATTVTDVTINVADTTNILEEEIEQLKLEQQKSALLKGQDYKFINKYVLWAHSNTKDPNAWGIDSFDKIVTISNVSEFWRLFNNFEKFDYINKHYFLMKENVVPLWEHHTNAKGGICSFRTKISESINILVFLATMMALGQILENDTVNDIVMTNDDINGVSISPHGPNIIVRIWNKEADDSFISKLSKNITNKYGDLSIMYKKNSSKY